MSRKYADRDPADEINKAFKLFDEDNSGNSVNLTLRKNFIEKTETSS